MKMRSHSAGLSKLVTIGLAIAMVVLLAPLAGCPVLPPTTPSDGTSDPNDGGSDPNDPNLGTGANNPDGTTDGGAAGGGDTGAGGTVPPRPSSVALERIVKFGDTVPNVDGATFTYFGTPIINDAGQVAFWAAFEGHDTADAGIFVWDDGTLRHVLDDRTSGGVPVPGITPAEVGGGTPFFGDVTINQTDPVPPLLWGTGGRLIFTVTIVNGGSAGVFRWRASDGDMILVASCAQQGLLFDDVSGTTFSGDYFQPGLSDNGIVSFMTEYTYITDANSFVLNRRGLYTSNGVTVSRVVDAHPPRSYSVPDGGSDAAFVTFSELTAVNMEGDIVFQAQLTGGDATRGVYLARAGALYRVIDNRPSPSFSGLPSGAVINAENEPFAGIALGSNLRLTVETTITEGTATRDVVLYYMNDTWTQLSGAQGNPATAALSGINTSGQTMVLANRRPQITDRGTPIDLSPSAASLASVSWLDHGGAINNNGRALVRFERNASAPGIAFWNGAELLVVVDSGNNILSGVREILTVESIEIDRPGRSGSLNDRDEMVFRAADWGADQQVGTPDDTQSIYIGRAQ